RRQLSSGRRVCRRDDDRSGRTPRPRSRPRSGATRLRKFLRSSGGSPGDGTHRHQRGRLGLGDEEAEMKTAVLVWAWACLLAPSAAEVESPRAARYAIDPLRSAISWELPAT